MVGYVGGRRRNPSFDRGQSHAWRGNVSADSQWTVVWRRDPRDIGGGVPKKEISSFYEVGEVE